MTLLLWKPTGYGSQNDIILGELEIRAIERRELHFQFLSDRWSIIPNNSHDQVIIPRPIQRLHRPLSILPSFKRNIPIPPQIPSRVIFWQKAPSDRPESREPCNEFFVGHFLRQARYTETCNFLGRDFRITTTRRNIFPRLFRFLDLRGVGSFGHATHCIMFPPTDPADDTFAISWAPLLFGLFLSPTGTYVERNVVADGCGCIVDTAITAGFRTEFGKGRV